MSITYYSRDLGEKNFKTMNDVMKVQREMIKENTEELQKMKATIAQLQLTIRELTGKTNGMFAQLKGTGATS